MQKSLTLSKKVLAQNKAIMLTLHGRWEEGSWDYGTVITNTLLIVSKYFCISEIQNA